MRKFITRADLLLVVVVIGIALAVRLSFNNARGSQCVISVSGAPVRTVDLTTDGTFSVPERPNIVFEVREGGVAFITSDCPDKTCVKTGFIRHQWQTAACLPNETSIRVLAESDSEIDMLAH